MSNLVGLRGKLTAAVALPIVGIALFFAIYVPTERGSTARSSMQASAANHMRVIADLIARQSEALGQRKPGEFFEGDLQAALKHHELRYLAVLDAAGTVVASYEAQEGWLATEQLVVVGSIESDDSDDVLHIRAPIPPPPQGVAPVAATVVAGYAWEGVDELVSESQLTFVLLGAALVVLGVLIGWLASTRIEKPMRDMSERLTSVSDELVGAARTREASAAEEAAAVEETRRTMDMLLNSAQKIADSASVVLGNAERTLDGNREISERIEQLNRHAEKVAEILATIMQVADRTDLLALNAALEGTKAGEAGKGFTLVAKEMRRLAENVMESVEGIRRLMGDVRSASHQAVEASRAGIGFSEETTRSVREIALVTQQQRKATEQVSRSMDEMTELLNHAMADIKSATRSAASLAKLSKGLSALIERVRASKTGKGDKRKARGG